MQTQIHTDVDGKDVVSYLHRAGSKTLVVIIHGHNTDSSRGRFLTIAKALEKAGVDALRFSVTRETIAENTFLVTTVTEEAQQARAVLESLRARYENIVLIGHSQGGMIALHLRDLAQGIVFLHSVFTPREHVLEKIKVLDKTIEELHAGAKSALTLPNGKTFVYTAAHLDDFVTWRPLEMLSDWEGASLFVAGRHDASVREREVRLGFDTAKEPKKFLELIGEHNFSNDEAAIIANETLAWMSANGLR